MIYEEGVQILQEPLWVEALVSREGSRREQACVLWGCFLSREKGLMRAKEGPSPGSSGSAYGGRGCQASSSFEGCVPEEQWWESLPRLTLQGKPASLCLSALSAVSWLILPGAAWPPWICMWGFSHFSKSGSPLCSFLIASVLWEWTRVWGEKKNQCRTF